MRRRRPIYQLHDLEFCLLLIYHHILHFVEILYQIVKTW